MKITMKKPRLVALAAVAIVLAVVGIAGAYWTRGGTGTGQATAGSLSDIHINQAITPSGLYPGGPAKDLFGTFNNPNESAVHISSISATVHPFSSQSNGSKPACTQADFVVEGSSGTNVVPAGNNVGSWQGLTIRLVDGAGNQDNCQGVGITIDYTASP